MKHIEHRHFDDGQVRISKLGCFSKKVSLFLISSTQLPLKMTYQPPVTRLSLNCKYSSSMADCSDGRVRVTADPRVHGSNPAKVHN